MSETDQKLKCLKLLPKDKRDKAIPLLEDKFVQNLCDNLVDDTLKLSYKIRETLANVMIKILLEKENANKIGTIAIEAVDVVCRTIIDRPVILFCIMEKRDSNEYFKKLIIKYFSYAKKYENGLQGYGNSILPLGPVEKFSIALENLFNNPPPSWFSNIKQVSHGGKKTMRTKRKLNKKITQRKIENTKTLQKGGEGDDFVNTFETGVTNQKNIQARQQFQQQAAQEAKQSNQDDFTQQQKTMELYKNFGKKVLEQLTKKMNEPSSKDLILTKILNSSYLYCLSNMEEIIDTIVSGFHENLVQTPILSESSEIIIIQALSKCGIHIHNCINSAFSEIQQDEMRKGRRKENVVFDPTTSEFISKFSSKLHNKIRKNVLIKLD